MNEVLKRKTVFDLFFSIFLLFCFFVFLNMEQSKSKTETKPKDYCVRYLFYSFISTVSVAAVSCAVSSTFWTVLPRSLLASNIVSLSISFYFLHIGVSKLRVFTTTRVDDVDKMSFLIHKNGNRFALSLYVMHC